MATIDEILQLFACSFTVPGGETQDITKANWLDASVLNVHAVCFLLVFIG